MVVAIDRRWPAGGRFVHAAGVRLHVLAEPARDGAPALVLLHGASGNLREPLAALGGVLGGRFRLVAVDRPGHGHSARGPRRMSDPALQADAIAAALRTLKTGPCFVLGHSWGASVATALAQRHPEEVRGLILVAPATHPWPGGVSARSRFFALPLLGRVLAELLVVPLGCALMPGAIRQVFRPDPVPPDYVSRIGALLAIRPRSFVANCRDVVDLYGHLVRLSAGYHRIQAPTEIVTGDADRTVAPGIHAYGLARDIPRARLTVLPGAGHMPHWSRTPELVALIDALVLRAGAPVCGDKGDPQHVG